MTQTSGHVAGLTPTQGTNGQHGSSGIPSDAEYGHRSPPVEDFVADQYRKYDSEHGPGG